MRPKERRQSEILCASLIDSATMTSSNVVMCGRVSMRRCNRAWNKLFFDTSSIEWPKGF